MDQRNVTITIVHIVNHDAATRVLVELRADDFVLVVATQVEEVYTYLLSFYLKFFDTVIDANCRNVTFYETTFAISLDQATLACLLVSDRDDLEKRMGWLRHLKARVVKVEVVCRILGARLFLEV